MAQITKVTKKSLEKLSLKKRKALLFVVLHQHILLRKFVAIQMLMIMMMVSSCRLTNIVHDSALRGPAFVLELINGDPTRMFDILRVVPACFIKLSNFLSERTSLKGTKTITVEEKNEVIEAPKHEEFDEVAKPTTKYFKNCIGAIDGTHIPITMPKGRESYRCRKGFPSLNVMVVVDFNMKFRNVHSGWEGSAHDSRVLEDAIHKKYFVIPDGTYYLADGGYGISEKIMTPYRNVRYHLKEYGNNLPKTDEELFNLRHSSLRNVVERTIGKFKKRFRIMKETSEYSSKLVARWTITEAEKIFEIYNDDDAGGGDDDDDDDDDSNNNESPNDETSEESRTLGRDNRGSICTEMWRVFDRSSGVVI